MLDAIVQLTCCRRRWQVSGISQQLPQVLVHKRNRRRKRGTRVALGALPCCKLNFSGIQRRQPPAARCRIFRGANERAWKGALRYQRRSIKTKPRQPPSGHLLLRVWGGALRTDKW